MMEDPVLKTADSFQKRMESWDQELMRVDEAGLWAPPNWERGGAGRILRRRRIFEGLAQSELAGRSGVDQSDISRVERGLDCRWSTLARLAGALECELVVRLRPRDPARPPSRNPPTHGRRRRTR